MERTRRSARLAISSLGLTAAMALASTVLLVIGPERSAPSDVFGGVGGLSFVGLALAYEVVGAVVAVRMPAHRVGWLFCLTGVAIGLVVFSWQYADVGLHSPPVRLPGSSLAPAFPGEPAAGLLGLSLLLFPDGHLPSRRWRPALALSCWAWCC